MRIFTAALATETNTFAPFPTGQRAFEAYGFVSQASAAALPANGPAVVGQALDSPNTAPLAIFRAKAHAAGDELIESLSAFAQPAGLTVRAVYEQLRDHILRDLRAAQAAGPVHLVLLVLHGAWWPTATTIARAISWPVCAPCCRRL
jgi:microcystin degradation protein MlrC